MGVTMISGGVPAGGATACETAGCDGTYMFCWTGDLADTDEACFANGTVQKDGAVTGGAIGTDGGEVGNGYRKTANNQNILWLVEADDGISDDQGTIWMSIRVADSADASAGVLESYIGTADKLLLVARPATNLVRFLHYGTATSDNVYSVATWTDATWTRISASWRVGGAGDAESAGVAGSWADDASANLDVFASAADDVTIGENSTGGGETTQIDIDNVYITAGYKDADPYVP